MSNFTFLYPLWLIGLLPVAALYFWLRIRKQNQTLVAPHIAKALGIERGRQSAWLIRLALVSWLIAIIALAGPSFEKTEHPTYNLADARVLVMDMSESMYATDIKPNRLTQARYKAHDLLEKWHEGSTGMVAYAADAYTISPMTTDTHTILNLLPNLSPDLMPYQGSNPASGIKLAISLMQHAGLSSGNIVLIADDIDKSDIKQIVPLLKGTHWSLSILGVGTKSGAPIPLKDGSMLQNSVGNPVVAKTHFDNMRQLASDVGGYFTPMQLDSSDINTIAKQSLSINAQARKNKNNDVKEPLNNGYWFVLALLLPSLLMFRRGVLFSFSLFLIPLLTPRPVEASPWLNQDQQAMEMYKAKDYKGAASTFTNKEWQGVSEYDAGNYKQAIEALKDTKNGQGKYNLANAYAQNKEYQKAIDLYQQVLKQQPDNKDAKYNLDIVKKAQQQQQQKSDKQNRSSQSNQSKSEPKNQQNNAGENNQQQASSENGQQEKKQNQSHDSKEPSNDSKNQNSANQNQADQKPKSEQENQDNGQQTKNDQQSEEPDSQDDKLTQKRQAHESEQQEPADNQANGQAQTDSAQQSNQEHVDPALRKLDQVETIRDPATLLRAEILLQANNKQPPKYTGKKW